MWIDLTKLESFGSRPASFTSADYTFVLHFVLIKAAGTTAVNSIKSVKISMFFFEECLLT